MNRNAKWQTMSAVDIKATIANLVRTSDRGRLGMRIQEELGYYASEIYIRYGTSGPEGLTCPHGTPVEVMVPRPGGGEVIDM